MAVMTATSGGIHEHNAAISPGPYVPISAMNTPVPGVRCSLMALANPISLLKLAGLATTSRRSRSSSRAYSFVVVLPYDPVTARIRGPISVSFRCACSTHLRPILRSRGPAASSPRSINAGIPSATMPAASAVRSSPTPSASSAAEPPPTIPASRRSRSVHRSGEVDPLRPRPNGPAAAATSAPNTAHSHHGVTASATTPAGNSRTLRGVDHQRIANRTVEPAR